MCYSMALTPYVNIVTMQAAVRTPIAIDGNALLSCMSSIAAIRAPVHAPVPGSGIATNIIKPQNWYLRTCSFLLSALSSKCLTMRASLSLLLCIHLKILRINSIMKGIGTRLPITDTIKASGIGSPAITPAGIAARSSSTGTMAIKNVMTIFPIVVPQSEIIRFSPHFVLLPVPPQALQSEP